MSYQPVRDVYFLQEKADYMRARYAILKIFDNRERIVKKLSENARLPGNYETIRCMRSWHRGISRFLVKTF